jgi:hypothetical protein
VVAARQVVRGAERLTRFVLGISRLFQGKATYHVAPINWETGLMIRLEVRLHSTLSIDADGTRILAVYNRIKRFHNSARCISTPRPPYFGSCIQDVLQGQASAPPAITRSAAGVSGKLQA